MTDTNELTKSPTHDDLVEIAATITMTIMGADAEPVADEPDLDGPVVTGTVQIAGMWEGTVTVKCTRALADAFAAAMFGTDVEELAPGEVADTIGELTNMTGGAVKALVAEQGQLGLPTVSEGIATKLRVPGGTRIAYASFLVEGEPLEIGVYTANA